MNEELQRFLEDAVALPPARAIERVAELIRRYGDEQVGASELFLQWSAREDVRSVLQLS